MSLTDPQKIDYLRSQRWVTAAQRAYIRPAFKYPEVAKDFIPVMASGGVGDLVITLGVSAALSNRVMRPVRVWTLYPDAAQYIIDHWDQGSQVSVARSPFPGFDFWVRINSMSMIMIEPEFKGFHNFPEMAQVFMQYLGFQSSKPWDNYIRFHPQLDGEVARTSLQRRLTRFSLPYEMLGLAPYAEPYWIRAKVGTRPSHGHYITVHDGFDTTQVQEARATKTWDLSHWETVVREIQERHPEYLIIQIGGKNSRPIPGVRVNLIGKTTVPEALDVLHGSALHIDGDSGFVHVARHMRVPSVVMFGPTPVKFFGYPENENLSAGDCQGCMWVTEEWLHHCPLQKPSPECMDRISPEQVLEAVKRKLK